jgi:hypothetical protein
MSQLTGKRIVNALYGLMSGLDAADRTLIEKVLSGRIKVKAEVGDAGASATSVTDKFVWYNDTGVSVRATAARHFAAVTLAPGATHNCAFVVESTNAANSATATVASYTSDVAGGTATKGVAKALTVTGGTSTAAVIPSGYAVIISATKGGSGVLIGATATPSVVEIDLELAI